MTDQKQADSEAYLDALERQVDQLLNAAEGDREEALILAAATILDLAKNVPYGLIRLVPPERVSPAIPPPPVAE